jgi:hypothetical protein
MLRSEDVGVHYEAVGVIGNLVHSSQDIKRQVLSEGALQPVINLLSSSCPESQREAALLLGQFATTDNGGQPGWAVDCMHLLLALRQGGYNATPPIHSQLTPTKPPDRQSPSLQGAHRPARRDPAAHPHAVGRRPAAAGDGGVCAGAPRAGRRQPGAAGGGGWVRLGRRLGSTLVWFTWRNRSQWVDL